MKWRYVAMVQLHNLGVFQVIAGDDQKAVENRILEFFRYHGMDVPEGVSYEDYYQETELDVLVWWSDEIIFV